MGIKGAFRLNHRHFCFSCGVGAGDLPWSIEFVRFLRYFLIDSSTEMTRGGTTAAIAALIFVFIPDLANRAGVMAQRPYHRGPAVIQTSTAQPVVTPTSTAASVTEPSGNTEKPAVECGKLGTGVHPDPKNKCSATFYVCSNGIVTEQKCPKTLYYDRQEKQCDYYDNVFDCTGKKKPASTPAPPKPKPSPASLPSIEFDCKNKKDGSYLPESSKCSKHYFKCTGGVALKVNCSEGLYYNSEKDQCDKYADVFSCSGKRPQTTTTTTAPPPPTPEKVPVDCGKLGDGDHSDPEKKCSGTYYTCSNKIGYRRQCAPGTVFDKSIGICDSRENVPDCTGKPRQATKPTPANLPAPVTKPPYDCEKRDDGNYPAAKCNSNYYVCVSGTAVKAFCPNGTVYDSAVKQCGYKEEMPECGGTRPSSPIVITQTKSYS